MAPALRSLRAPENHSRSVAGSDGRYLQGSRVMIFGPYSQCILGHFEQLPVIPPVGEAALTVPEPVRPKPPTDKPTGGFVQTLLDRVVSAPTPTGISWDGVGVGLAQFVPWPILRIPTAGSARNGSVQWNNTSFAVFDKTTGALLFGPAAGNTLFPIARRRLCNSQRW